MDTAFYTIYKKDLFDLFARLTAAHRVIVPYKKGEKLYFDAFDSEKTDAIDLGGVRQSEPMKSFLNHPREDVLGTSRKDIRPLVLAGIKGCDLQSLTVQDFVFQGQDVEDPIYAENRNKTIIISSDCTYAKETCFCLAMDGAPYPKKNFDINLSVIKDDRFLVEVASDKGRKIVADYRGFFKDHDPRDIDIRQETRDRVSLEARGFIDKRRTPATDLIKGAVKKNYNEVAFWQDFSSTCVECGACNLVCPTCHCFLLFDEKSKDGRSGRFRIWDSCLYKTFARVAGGANPRRHLYERLRNRFDKKFEFFPEVLNYFACTGCGRCIEACPGDIDIREVLKGLVTGKWNKPPND